MDIVCSLSSCEAILNILFTKLRAAHNSTHVCSTAWFGRLALIFLLHLSQALVSFTFAFFVPLYPSWPPCFMSRHLTEQKCKPRADCVTGEQDGTFFSFEVLLSALISSVKAPASFQGTTDDFSAGETKLAFVPWFWETVHFLSCTCEIN